MTRPTGQSWTWWIWIWQPSPVSLLPSTVQNKLRKSEWSHTQTLEKRWWKSKNQRAWRQDFSVVQWLKLHLPKQGEWVWSLGGVGWGALRTHMPQGQKTKQNKTKHKNNTVTNSIKIAKKKIFKKDRGLKGFQKFNQFLFWKNLSGSRWTRTLVHHLNCNTLHLAVIP